MRALGLESSPPRRATEEAVLVAVVGGLCATSMLFASLTSAYLVRRSFDDWRPLPALWPIFLLACAIACSGAVEVAARGSMRARRRGLIGLGSASSFYLLGALSVIASLLSRPGGLESPFLAFVALLLSVHVAHALLGGVFAFWILRQADPAASEHGLRLVGWVTHFLTALLIAIVSLLFGLQ